MNWNWFLIISFKKYQTDLSFTLVNNNLLLSAVSSAVANLATISKTTKFRTLREFFGSTFFLEKPFVREMLKKETIYKARALKL